MGCAGIVVGACVGAYVFVPSQQNNSFWKGDTMQLTSEHSFQTFDLFLRVENPRLNPYSDISRYSYIYIYIYGGEPFVWMKGLLHSVGV